MAMIVSVDQCKSWEKHGRTDFLKFCKNQIAKDDEISLQNLKQALYELFWHVLKGKIKPEVTVTCLAQVVDLHHLVPSLTADVLNLIDNETSCNAESTDSDEDKQLREKFINFLQSCSTLVPEPLLKERIDAETLENIAILTSKSQFTQKYVKTKTRLYYKQQKFNLLREESEGYSKLITELQQDFSQTGTAYQEVLDNIRSLIGGFNLDPNRVLDIILESFECCLEQDDFFVPLLRAYTTDRETICHILGFKFHFYQQTHDSRTPESLYRVAALLLYHKLVDLDTLYPHLTPSDGDIVDRHKTSVSDAKAYVRKLSVVSLADKDKGKDDKKQEKEEEEKKEKLNQALSNQKVGLVEAMLQVGNWEHAEVLMKRLPPFFAMNHAPVAQALAQLLHYLIDKLYDQYSGLPSCLIRRRQRPTGGQAAKRIRQAAVYSDLKEQVFPMLSYLGPHIYCDTMLMVKLLRLASSFMQLRAKAEEPEELATNDDVFRCFLTVMDECILPALSLLPSNCCLSEEVWGFLKLLKYEYRYRLYGQWKNDTHLHHPKLMCARADVVERAKYIMKRLAKENVKQLGRQLGKLSHSNPGALFEYVLSQIQKYDNFIGPVVDSLKFLTSLSYDMLAYCIMEALANPDRERMKHDDTNISLWLQSLANFSGAIFKKYQIELGGLLQYVVNQLKAGKSYDLLILREIITKMAGIEVSEEITDDQLEAMSGGDILKQEGGQYSQVRNTKKSSSRLKDTLVEYELAMPLCLLMAQQRNGILFTPTSGQLDGDNRHLKLIGKLYDQCHDTGVQFINFLGGSLSNDELQRRVPRIDELLSTCHIPADVAFALSRFIFNNQITAKWEELKKIDRKDKEKQTTSAKTQRYIEACTSVMNPLVEALTPLTAGGVCWDDLTPVFYATFWTLTMTDLQVPTNAYAKQINQLRMQMVNIEENNDMAQSKKKKEKERCISLIDKIQDEEKKQTEHVNRVTARLKHDKDQWFVSKSQKHATVTSLLQMCLFPRCCYTAIDAIYSAKFLNVLHMLKTPNFSSLICYDRILADITWPMTSCTENEAHRYGRFLCTIFEDIMRWHSDKTIFEKECGNFPGFKTVFRNRQTSNVEKESSVADQLDYENYRHLCYKWHYHMTKVVLACMESTEFIQMRNALIVLTKILPHFPKLNKFGHAVEKKIEKICQEQKEKRPDLYALGMGLCGQMKARKKNWMIEGDFHVIRGNKAAAAKVEAAKKDGDTAKTDDNKKQEKSEKPEKPREGNKEANKETASKDDARASKSDAKDKKDKESDSSRERSAKSSKEKKDRKEKKEVKKEKTEEKPRKEEKRTSRDKEVKEERRREDGERARDSPSTRADARTDGYRDKPGEDRERARGEKDRQRERTDDRDDSKKMKMSERKEREREDGRKERDGRSEREDGKYKERDREREGRDRDRERERDHRGSSAASSGSEIQQNSAEPSPRYAEDRDNKRRKVESSRTKSPGRERNDRDKPREKEKAERKRDHSYDNSPAEKRHKSDDSLVKSKVNGDSGEGPSKKRSGSRERGHRDVIDNHVSTPTSHSSNKKSPRRKESPEKSARDRKSEKHSSKKSKHH